MMSRTRPRRVLMTIDAVGGVWRYALDLSRGLSEQGIEVLLLGLGPKPDAARSAEPCAIDGVELRWTDLPLDWMEPDDSCLAEVGPAIESVAETEDVDVLHLNLPTQVPALRQRPVVTVAHSCLATWFAAMHPGEALPERWRRHHAETGAGLRRADIVLTPSASHAASLRNVYGDLTGLRVVHNGSSAPVSSGPKLQIAVSAGRWWDPAKNLETLDAAAAGCDWPLQIAGPMRAPDGHLCKAHNVVALGDLGRPAIEDLFGRAGIFVSSARYEPFGLAVLEAARARCALVLADIPTFRELWDGAALFVAPCDADGFTSAINFLARSTVERATLGAAAARRAESYSTRVQTERVMSAYADILQRQPVFADVC